MNSTTIENNMNHVVVVVVVVNFYAAFLGIDTSLLVLLPFFHSQWAISREQQLNKSNA